jgi:EpsI family protein
MLKLRSYLPAAVLIAGCAFIWNMRSQSAVPLVAPLSGILSDYPGYTFQEMHLTDDERRVLGNTAYVARLYMRDTVPAFTTFVSYYERQTQGKTIHSPRNCLPGAGWEVLTAGTTTVPVDGASYVVNRYELKKGPETAVVYYWYQGRGRVVANEYRVKWNLLRDAALMGHTEEALVRVMVPTSGRALAERNSGFAGIDSLAGAVSSRLIREVAHSLPGGMPIPDRNVASALR